MERPAWWRPALGDGAWRSLTSITAFGPTAPTTPSFVRDAAAALRLPFEARRTDVAALASAEGRSIEDAGREARYRFLEEVAPEGSLIATAHTADDAAETVLINLLRGSGLAGVRGIPARRGRVVRPLIGERRARLRELLDAAGIAYRDDPSNADPEFLRNRVRAELLPLLEALRARRRRSHRSIREAGGGRRRAPRRGGRRGARAPTRPRRRDRLARSAVRGARPTGAAPRDR